MLLCIVLPVACVHVATTPIAASAQTSPDVVRLRDGTFLRCTIVEHSAEQLVILLPTGETRTYRASEVESAGPVEPTSPRPRSERPPERAIAPAPSPLVARLHVTTSQRRLSLHRLTGSGTVVVWTGSGAAHARVDAFSLLCTAPCNIRVPAGSYQLGIANGTGPAIRAGGPVDVRGEMHLDLRYEDRTWPRVVGWLTWIGGLAVGAAMEVAAVLTAGSGGSGSSNLDVPLMVAGGVIAGIGVIVGVPLAFLNDAATFRFH